MNKSRKELADSHQEDSTGKQADTATWGIQFHPGETEQKIETSQINQSINQKLAGLPVRTPINPMEIDSSAIGPGSPKIIEWEARKEAKP